MDNRAVILNTALSLFCKRGYDAVGVQEIVDQAGITKPTLYYYFGSKQGLMKEILRTYTEQLERCIEKEAGFPGAVPEGLYRIARMYFDFAGSNRQFYLFMMGLFYAGRDSEGFQAVYPLIEKYHRQLAGFFERHSAQLGNMNGRQQLFADSFLGTLDSHLMMAGRDVREDEELKISDEQVQQIVRQFLYGIFS